MPDSHLRIARASDRFKKIAAMYCRGLALQILGTIDNHAGFDGIMAGRPGLGYHLEFTRRRGQPAGEPPSEEKLLVFYLPDEQDWEAACHRMAAAGFSR